VAHNQFSDMLPSELEQVKGRPQAAGKSE
jgi:hypothetical protein